MTQELRDLTLVCSGSFQLFLQFAMGTITGRLFDEGYFRHLRASVLVESAWIYRADVVHRSHRWIDPLCRLSHDDLPRVGSSLAHRFLYGTVLGVERRARSRHTEKNTTASSSRKASA